MAKGSGIKKELKCSPELRAVVKEKRMARGKVMGAIWKYAKKHKLQSKDDGRIIECDDNLSAVFKKVIAKKRKIESRGNKIRVPKGSIFFTEIMKSLSKHLS